MKRKMFVLLTLIGLFSVLLGTGVAFAERPPPPPTPEPPFPPGGKGGPTWDPEKGKPLRGPLGGISASQVEAASIPLGQPGLSFRYVQTFGITESAYPDPGPYRLNGPSGLFVDGSNNVYVVEDRGYRVLTYDSAGANTLALGTAGLCERSNTGLCSPQDVAVDGGGNFWLAESNRVIQYNASGTFLQQLPPSNSWWSGNDNTHFQWGVSGIVFDSAGRMFVSDRNNHRVQVYTFSGGSPVYDATIGVTGAWGSDNSHFNQPYRLAVDSSNRLYVTDSHNGRVQRCTFAGTWTCEPFATGLNQPQGIALDSGNNVYIADSNNGRVLKCDSGGTCSPLISGLPNWVPDVAVDSSGSIYISDWNRAEVRKYNISGSLVGTFVGTTNVPYTADTSRINSPSGIAVATDGSIYVTEANGYRLIKLNAAGVQQWAKGQAGVWGSDTTHFGYLEGKPAIAPDGRIYVPDSDNNRILIYDASGTLAAPPFGSYGNGDYQFNWPGGVAISPVNGDIYITDRNNHRVQVYNSSKLYKATLGVTNVPGVDATHFNNPRDVAVDTSGNIYVADAENYRVQKCTLSGSSYTCSTFVGETGVFSDGFAHLHPLSVAVDSAGRVYVADEWNGRVQVFDSSGAYLTTIGGNWGNNTGRFRNSSGIAFDSAGNVYVTDRENHRIQKFAPGVPGWLQVNINGFGERPNYIASLGSFGGQLYAGTLNFSGNGAQLWRTSTGTDWTPVITNGFGNTYNGGIDHLIEFNGQFYAGTWADEVNGGEVYRSPDGNTWTRVVSQGFGDPTNGEVFRFAVFNNQIYASTWSYTSTHGSEIWRSSDGVNWTQVISNGFGDTTNVGVVSFEEFNGSLYAGTWGGGEVWRSSDGQSWTQVNADGFGNTDNYAVGALAAFNGYLYAGTGNWDPSTNTSQGGQIWLCPATSGCDEPSDWTQVTADGFGNPQNNFLFSLRVFDGRLYAVAYNEQTGLEVWRTADGTHWEQVGFAGFGDSNNDGTYLDNSVTVFNNRLFIGTMNWANGGEVWQMLNQIYLPLIMR